MDVIGATPVPPAIRIRFLFFRSSTGKPFPCGPLMRRVSPFFKLKIAEVTLPAFFVRSSKYFLSCEHEARGHSPIPGIETSTNVPGAGFMSHFILKSFTVSVYVLIDFIL